MIKKRHVLSKRDTKRVIDMLKLVMDVDEDLVDSVIEIAELKSGDKLYIVDGKPLLYEMKIGDNTYAVPTLWALAKLGVRHKLPIVVVDMGAVPHICNGADVMRPGIRDILGEFKRGDLVVVVDEKYGKPIAVCRSLFDADEIKSMKRGKVLQNIHYVGDEYWEVCSQVGRS